VSKVLLNIGLMVHLFRTLS